MPQPTESLKPSHPGVDASNASEGNVHALHLPTHIRHPHPHPTPVAVSASAHTPNVNDADNSILAASTPSLVPSASGVGGDTDSGYAASTESGTPAPPTPLTPSAFHLRQTSTGQERETHILPPMHIPPSAARAVGDVVARAETGDSPLLDSVRFDSPPSNSMGDAPSASSAPAPSASRIGDEGVVSVTDERLTGVDDAPLSPLVVSPSARAATGDSGVEGEVDEPPSPDADTEGVEGGVEGDNGEQGEGGKKSEKPKLLQQLKEKMHVGGGGLSS
ncbi:hypothetical protein C8R45DRAFT_1102278 [Mycena sanguinolenta]|nr:hypothetical protein C8R45DRAFT_1102278 [Mycena sanguinolenta]